MNWIERIPEIKGKDLYSQNSEGLILEYIFHSLYPNQKGRVFDIGSGDGFILSNSRHLKQLGFQCFLFDKINGLEITLENCTGATATYPDLISIDIDGNDYWILNTQLPFYKPSIVIAEFNPAFTDSRTIKYNPNHEWVGDDYYGFSFEAGKKLADKHGYEIIFNVANMNLIMVRKDLINVPVPPVTYEQVKFFKESNRTDWEFI